MKVRIPLLQLGPYLRPFLFGLIAISGGLAVIFFVAYLFALRFARQTSTADDFLRSALKMASIAITVTMVYAVFHFLGMP